MYNIAFAGTGDFAEYILKFLCTNQSYYKIKLIITQPEKPQGRNRKIKKSYFHEISQQYNIKLIQPLNINNSVDVIKENEIDLFIVASYGQFLGDKVLNTPKYNCINIHGSLLPKLRGASPIQSALINGYTKTGITIMKMVKKMDAGDILSFKEVKIEENDNYLSLKDKLKVISCDLLKETIPEIFDKKINFIKQKEEEATYCTLIKRKDCLINWNNKCKDIFNLIRGLYPKPGAYSVIGNLDIKILDASLTNIQSNSKPGLITKVTKSGIYVSTNDLDLLLKKIQIPGKKPTFVKDILNGSGKNIFKINDYFI